MLTLPAIALSLVALATGASGALVVASYDYLTSPSSPYPDSTGMELTDGVDSNVAWPSAAVISLESVSALVGWQFSDPGIQFNFSGTPTVSSLEIWAADSEGAAGVALPTTITLRTIDSAFLRTFTVVNPAGSGSTVPLIFDGFTVNASSLIVEATRPSSNWIMFSEVRFNSIPEPSSFIGAMLGCCLAFLRRKR